MSHIETFASIAFGRRSVRGFRSEPVDKAIIEWALEMATTAPSSCNTQPWRVHIASGEALELLRTALTEAAKSGAAGSPEVEYAARYVGKYRERQVDAARRLFNAQGIERNDHEGRKRSFLRNYAFFDAPHAAFLFIPPEGGVREAADCGKFAQTFMLALAAAGVGSCPQGSLSERPEVVRRTLGIVSEGKLLLGISFGYADDSHPTASVRPPRMLVSDFTTFHS